MTTLTEHWAIYRIAESLCCTLERNTALYANYTLIKKLKIYFREELGKIKISFLFAILKLYIACIILHYSADGSSSINTIKKIILVIYLPLTYKNLEVVTVTFTQNTKSLFYYLFPSYNSIIFEVKKNATISLNLSYTSKKNEINAWKYTNQKKKKNLP